MAHIAAVAAARRRELGLSQRQLAERAGWQQARLSAIETGTGDNHTLSVLLRLAEALEVPIGYLFAGYSAPG